MICSICIDPIKKDQAVVCMSCEFTTDKACTKKYLLDQACDAHCMQCKARWNLKFVCDTFGRSWTMGTSSTSYRTHLKKQLLDREKSKLPESIAELSINREQKRAYQQARMCLSLLVEEKRKSYFVCCTKQTEVDVLWAAHRNSKMHIEEQRTILQDLRTAEYIRGLTTTPTPGYSFLCPCPADSCRGLITTTTLSCGVCELHVCKNCHCAIKEPPDHKCSATDLETVRMLQTDTKPCPNCAVPIHRISGCSQMWCVCCHRAFDWDTGKAVSGTIHNPHALRWFRTHDQPIREVRDLDTLPQMPDLGLDSTNMLYHTCKLIHTAVFYACSDTVTGRVFYRPFCDLRPKSFGDLRIAFLCHKITEKQWQQRVFLRERANTRKQAIVDILATFRTLGIEQFRILYHDIKDIGTLRALTVLISRMSIIRTFINSAFKDELEILGTKHPHRLGMDWRWN